MTDRYAVFGNPVTQSKSPFIHASFAAQFNDDIDYAAIEPPVDGFAAAVHAFAEAGARGANVTAPFKTDAYALATRRHDAAEICGASNCLKFEGGEILAQNFDGVGLVRDIEANLGLPLAGKRVLIAGAGGATRGVVAPFLDARVAELVIANRTVAKAEEIRDLMADRGPVTASGYDSLTDGFDLVLNSTSASLSGDAVPIPEAAFGGCVLAYDLSYGKGKTPFLKAGEAAGVARLADGVGMLVEQAAEAYAWWRGKRPETAAVIKSITISLN